MSNLTKYSSYKVAWSKIGSAVASGYYLEAITLCESIISDRLLSYVIGKGNGKANTRTSLHELIGAATIMTKADAADESSLLLFESLDDWRKTRNHAVHAFVKTMPGDSTIAPEEFKTMCLEIASQGAKLARSVCDWHRRELRKKQEKLRAN